MANKFVTQQSLTMLTATEVKSLANTAQINIAEDEILIYKYRDEFLHIQQVAERGLTNLDMLVENSEEFAVLATAWGFTTTVRDQYRTNLQYRKNLGVISTETLISNLAVSWLKPKTPTVDVAYYREKGNLVSLLDSTLFVPKLTQLKRQLGIVEGDGYTVAQEVVTAKDILVARGPKTAETTVTITPVATADNTKTVTTTVTTTVSSQSAPVVDKVELAKVIAATKRPTVIKNGTGAVFEITTQNDVAYGFLYSGSAGGEYYNVGDIISIPGDQLGGSARNNATITVTAVNNGAITASTISGTASAVTARPFYAVEVRAWNLAFNAGRQQT